ncbi:hypothetical protein J4526_08695 [Desulfurococcaceae archaeon MEX13E-LK6-19]|nr:hypothetical protein J4526_08695 [Desulfurococcaceae archaeon MEX13E-LK6-19]
MFIAGIDAGATKTKVVITDSNGHILAKTMGGPGNPTALGWDNALSNIVETLRNALQQAKLDYVDKIIASVAYTGWGKYRGRYVETFIREKIARQVIVLEDYKASLYTCFPEGEGIIYIMGTGSSCYGYYRGKEALVGGWGHLLGDEGSGYYVGREGITAALKYFDGRGEPTLLLRYLREWGKQDSVYEIVSMIYTSNSPKTLIASFAPYVVKAYNEGDDVAARILRNAVKEALLTIKTCIEKLHYDRREIGFTGGFYSGAKNILAKLIDSESEKILGFKITIKEPIAPIECALVLHELRKQNTSFNENEFISKCKNYT